LAIVVALVIAWAIPAIAATRVIAQGLAIAVASAIEAVAFLIALAPDR
jgi:hypothetical protein